MKSNRKHIPYMDRLQENMRKYAQIEENISKERQVAILNQIKTTLTNDIQKILKKGKIFKGLYQ